MVTSRAVAIIWARVDASFVAFSRAVCSKQTALENATKDASTRAHIIATALDVTITGVVSITDTPSYYPYPILYGGMSITSANTTPIVPPQSLTFTDTVQVVFAIG